MEGQVVGNKGHPLISGTHPKLSAQGCQGLTGMNWEVTAEQGGVMLTVVVSPTYVFLSTFPTQE
jgi:hypothetical protein